MNTSYPHIEPWPISFPAPPVCTVYMNLISRSIKQELEKREGRETADGAPAAFGCDLEQAAPAGARDGVGDGCGEARDQRLAEDVVARDEVDPHAPYINPKIEEPRKLGADWPVLKLLLLRFRLRSKPGRGGWRVRLGSSWARSDGRFRWLPQLP